MMNRNSLARLAAVAFNGLRDFYATFGYNKTLQYEDMLFKYMRQDIAARIVDAPASALWGNPPEITTGNDEFDKTWINLTKKHDLWMHLEQVDKLAGMGEFAVLLLGFGDQNIELPTDAQGKKDLIYLQPYSVNAAQINKLEERPTSPNYLRPSLYQISPFKDQMDTSIVIPTAVTDFKVHSSRVLHVAENCLSNCIIGNPRLVRVYNVLDDVLKTVGGTAETFWLSGNRGMHFNLESDVELSPEDEKDLSDEIDEYQHQLRRVLRTRGVEVNSLGSDVPDPKNLFEVLISLISGATGIPKRILTGSEAGQLASEQDRNNWADRVEERRENFGEPIVLKPLIRKLAAAGILPEVPEENIKIVWPDAFKLSPLERKQASAQTARAAGNLTSAINGTEGRLVSYEEGKDILGLEGLPIADPDLVKEAEEQKQNKVIEEKGGDNDG